MDSPRYQKGVALIIAIVTSLVLLLIVSMLIWQGKLFVRKQSMMADKYQLEIKSDSELYKAIYWNLKQISSAGVSTNDEQYVDWSYQKEPFMVAPGVSIEVRDESTKIPLLPTDYPLFEQLLRAVAVNDIRIPQTIARLKDWQDEDSFVNLNGMEVDGYVHKGEVLPRNFFIQSIDELNLVDGFDGRWLKKMRPHLSLFTPADFNYRLLPKELVELLDGKNQPWHVGKESVGGPSSLEQVIRQNSLDTLEYQVTASLNNAHVKKKVVFSTKTAMDSPYAHDIWNWQELVDEQDTN